MSSKKILIVLTSHSELGNTGEKTGFWIEEFASPYYAFIDAGCEVSIVSPAGGQAPIDPKSDLADFQTAATQRYADDKQAQTLVANTLKLSDVNQADFDAVFYPGGHGPLWDLTDNSASISLIADFIAHSKPVAAVCHASAALLNVKDAAGEYLVNAKQVTGFSNSEEDAVGLSEIVPFLLETELIQRGAHYKKGDDWGPFALQDGLLITGQNPASSELVAHTLLAAL